MDGGSDVVIEWRLHLESAPDRVYATLSTPEGRESFWAESAPEVDGEIQFEFPNGEGMRSRILEKRSGEKYAIEYFGGAATFDLDPDGQGGTDLSLRHTGICVDDERETAAGWVSVLLSLKAAVDHAVDLRNHDRDRTWDGGYVDN